MILARIGGEDPEGQRTQEDVIVPRRLLIGFAFARGPRRRIQIPPRTGPQGLELGPRCPGCAERLQRSRVLVGCAVCLRVFHESCWPEGACPTAACRFDYLLQHPLLREPALREVARWRAPYSSSARGRVHPEPQV